MLAWLFLLLNGQGGLLARTSPSPPPDLDCRFWSHSDKTPAAPAPGAGGEAGGVSVFYWWDSSKSVCLPCSRCGPGQHTWEPCSVYRDTQCTTEAPMVNNTSPEEEDTSSGEEDISEGVMVFQAKGHIEKGTPAFGTQKHHKQEPELEQKSSTREVHQQRMGEEFEKAGIKYPTEKSNTASFGNPKFYTDETDEDDLRLPREKHLANVVKEFLQAGDYDVNERNNAETAEMNAEEAPLTATKPSTNPEITKTAFRQIFKMMHQELEEREKPPAPRNPETEMVHHKLVITVASLTFFLMLACLAAFLLPRNTQQHFHRLPQGDQGE